MKRRLASLAFLFLGLGITATAAEATETTAATTEATAATAEAATTVATDSTAATTVAELYKVGDAFEPFTTKDQHDKEYTFEPGTLVVIVSHAMSEGKAANAFFSAKGASFLGDNKAIFIANIYGMPGVGRFFALPKMQRYPHRILLADAETFLARYPTEENKLTVLRLDEAGVITAIEFIAPKDGLPAVFGE